MLTASEIKNCVRNGDIVITPYDEDQQNGQPNSSDLHLDNITKVLKKAVNPFAANPSANYKMYKQSAKADFMKLANISEYYDFLSSNNDEVLSFMEDPCKDYYILLPGKLYLGSTVESTYTPKHIPCLSNKSSCERLGIDPIGSSGFGDIGFNGKWTLEITVKAITILKKGMAIAQIHFYKPKGKIEHTYNGKYQGQQKPTEGKFTI